MHDMHSKTYSVMKNIKGPVFTKRALCYNSEQIFTCDAQTVKKYI